MHPCCPGIISTHWVGCITGGYLASEVVRWRRKGRGPRTKRQVDDPIMNVRAT
jgi:hypothetical protein